MECQGAARDSAGRPAPGTRRGLLAPARLACQRSEPAKPQLWSGAPAAMGGRARSRPATPGGPRPRRDRHRSGTRRRRWERSVVRQPRRAIHLRVVSGEVPPHSGRTEFPAAPPRKRHGNAAPARRLPGQRRREGEDRNAGQHGERGRLPRPAGRHADRCADLQRPAPADRAPGAMAPLPCPRRRRGQHPERQRARGPRASAGR